MADTHIEWADKSWNPVTGCTKVSPGCKHCYAEGVADRFWATQYPPVEVATPLWAGDGPGKTSQRPRRFTDVQCHPDRLDQPLRWRKPRRVFVNSMSDLFHEDVPDAFIDQVFAVMALAPTHTFQILTKRAERMCTYLSQPDLSDQLAWTIGYMECSPARDADKAGENAHRALLVWPLLNVWLGVSVENQVTADARVPLLLQTPAAVRFLSCEPLLGPVEIRGGLQGCGDCDPCIGGRVDQCAVGSHHTGALHPDGIHWVIVGGESGPKARTCDVAWVRSIRDQCRASSVPCFVKQLGHRPMYKHAQRGHGVSDETYHPHGYRHGGIAFHAGYLHLKDRKGGDISEWPEDLQVREFPQ